jgi:UDP-N-acetylglucosamine 2-epimerase
LAEGVDPERIRVTGNMVIDALQIIARRVSQEKEQWERYFAQEYRLSYYAEQYKGHPFIVVLFTQRKQI